MEKSPIEVCANEDELMEQVDAVFIFEPIDRHFHPIMNALDHGCHVFCDSPVFLSRKQAEEALSLAKTKGLLVFDGLKTLHFPAFEHLMVMSTGVHVGKIVDIDVACSQIPQGWDASEAGIYDGAFYDWGATALMPAVKLLGCDFNDLAFHVHSEESGADSFTRMTARVGDASVSVRVGKGVKTEGEMVITGTKGYIYVPAPWWLTDYFEVRDGFRQDSFANSPIAPIGQRRLPLPARFPCPSSRPIRRAGRRPGTSSTPSCPPLCTCSGRPRAAPRPRRRGSWRSTWSCA